MSSAEQFIPRLVAQAKAQPNKVLFEYVNDDGVPVAKRTYKEFEAETRALAKRLVKHKQKHPKVGNIALLVYPPGLDFIIAFVACLRASVIAVPVYPPRGAKNKDLVMFLAVHSVCQAKIALTNSTYNFASRVAAMKDTIGSIFARKDGNGEEGLGKWPEDLEWMVTDGLGGDMANDDEIDQAKSSDVAFLQFTSGSTSLPKGVVLTHGNLAHNLQTIITALKADSNVVVVSWLPQYHDMGLIGSHLGAVYCGGAATLMSPITFVKNPPLWIDLVSSRKGTHLQAPNFAYRLTVRKFLARQQQQQSSTKLDLSSVRHIFNAAEPIDPTAIDEFCDLFGKFGLKREAMVPGYGLAEHTVYVCDGGRQRLVVSRSALEKENRVELLSDAASPDAMTLVGCGSPPANSNIHIVIVEPKSLRKLSDGLVGEIWITSPSKSNAYYGLDEKSRTELRAKLATDPKQPSEGDAMSVDSSQVKVEIEESKRKESLESREGSSAALHSVQYVSPSEDEAAREWLRTGDLGIWYQAELFVCGRIKDMLIIRGRNHFPQDIEATIERTDREKVRPGCSAAFTIQEKSSGGEEVVVVCFELRANSVPDAQAKNDLMSRVRANIAKEHGIAPFAVVALEEHSIPKTTSGKISRHRVKQHFLAKKLKQVAYFERAPNDDAVVDEEGILDGDSKPKVSAAAPKTQLKGADLLNKLKNEAGALLERDPETMDPNVPLVELGFDSMMVTQFKGAVINTLGVELPDEQLFDEKCTLDKVRVMIEDGVDAKSTAPQTATMAGRDDPVPIKQNANQRQPLLGSWKPGQKCGFCGC